MNEILVKCPICGGDGGSDGFGPQDKCCSECDTSEPINPIGCIIAQRLTTALCNSGLGITYDQVQKIVYGELNQIASEQTRGDWIEFPNGTTYTMTFTPNK